MLVCNVWVFIAVIFIVVVNIGTLEAAYRQKRCIVVQKQSGSRDADDDDDDDYRLPQPKNPRPDKIRADDALKRSDVEGIPAKLLKLMKPKWLKNRQMLRDKIIRDHLLDKNLSPYFLP